MKELIALAKAKPGKLNFAISGVGGAPHLAGVDFALRTGVNWAYIPYKGGAQAIADVVGGQAEVTFNGMLATYPLVKGGKLKLLAVSSAQAHDRDSGRTDRSPSRACRASRPDRGRASSRRPGRRPRSSRKLNAEIARIVAHRRCARTSASRAPRCARRRRTSSARSFAREKARWAKVVKDANVKID